MAGDRGATTVRLPLELAERAKRIKSPHESFNDLVTEAVEREVRRRQGLRALAEMRQIRERIAARGGYQPDSVPLIREMREQGNA